MVHTAHLHVMVNSMRQRQQQHMRQQHEHMMRMQREQAEKHRKEVEAQTSALDEMSKLA